ncbi:MAG: GNAT family N-acetyltransferase [Spirochaetaceae bacterium]|jgi:Leu/Phe-tRNA-protein transferase|nr:GNAT family N-acetyltransferase [Spirochaetaceae bacterium]
MWMTHSGHLLARPPDRPDDVIDYIRRSGYREEFIVSDDFSPRFLASLMRAGFLVMSVRLEECDGGAGAAVAQETFILLPKHHLTRSVLHFDRLRTSRSVRALLPRCQLRADADYDAIVQKCIDIHGDDWLTPPLVDSLRRLRAQGHPAVRPSSFALYKDGALVAGEFGVSCGRVYTSYSGYHEQNSCGRAQMILTARHLRERGYAFWDLGMPLDYKYTLGAEDLPLSDFVAAFRAARAP